LPVTLKLEGKLFDQWVALLEGECRALLRQKKTVLLDFSDVDYIDANGVDMVRGLPRKQTRVINAPAFIEGLLERGEGL
jgi:anti-anti-sigma regulatory factor